VQDANRSAFLSFIELKLPKNARSLSEAPA